MQDDKSSSEDLVRELTETKRRFGLALTAAGAGAWEWDIATNQTFWSDENYRVLGLPVGNGVATYEEWFSCVHPEDRAFAREQVEIAVQSQGDLDFEYRAVWPDGTVRWIRDVGKMMLDDAGAPIGMFGIQMDVTEKREMEATIQRSQKTEALGEIAAAIAHDFNNLLTVISGHAELLQDELSSESELREKTGEILHSADRAAELTSQLLSFGRRQTLRLEVLDLNALIHHLERLALPIIGEGVKFEMRRRPGKLPVRMDAGQLEHVFLNLLVNARDAMPGGGELRVTTEVEELEPGRPTGCFFLRAGTYAVVSVQDSGKGMDEETLSRIFDPFFSTKPRGQGSGLGLASAYGIIKQIDGDIAVESTVGQGTAFKVYLPLATSGEAPQEEAAWPAAAAAAAVAAAVADDADETIMVVEDNASILRLVGNILTRRGYDVLAASSAEDALRLLAERTAPLDLLVTDVVLTGMTGLELATRIRQSHADAAVLFMSGYNYGAFQTEELPGDAPQLLAKPFSGQQLLEKVRESLAMR